MYENNMRDQERAEPTRGNDARQLIFGSNSDCNRIQAYQYMHGREDD